MELKDEAIIITYHLEVVQSPRNLAFVTQKLSSSRPDFHTSH